MIKIQNVSFRKNMLAVAILAPALALTACGSESSNSSPAAQPKAPGPSTGVAYDGYLRNATVCVDENLNKLCDSGEKSAATGAGGKFNITDLTAVQGKLPLVLKATGGKTIDEDDGQPVANSFTYAAPAGSKTVSAFSTLIQVRTERLIASGESVAAAQSQAKRELAAAFGIDSSIDLTNYDAVAGTGIDTDGQLAANLHIVNQVLTQLIIKAQQGLGAAANTNPAATLLAVVDKVAAKAGVIKIKVDSAVKESGSVAADLTAEALDAILNDVRTDPATQPEAVTQADLDEAAKDGEKAKGVILENAKPDKPATGGTGGTGGSGS